MPSRESNSGDVAVGQTWRHKRERHRRVTIRAIYPDRPDFAYVDRNTSRRKQGISFATLRRDYDLYLTNEAK